MFGHYQHFSINSVLYLLNFIYPDVRTDSEDHCATNAKYCNKEMNISKDIYGPEMQQSGYSQTLL